MSAIMILKNKKLSIRILIYITAVLGFVSAAAVLAVNLHMSAYSSGFIIRQTKDLPRTAAVIVPGAAVWRGGRLSHILEDRVLTALDLYRKGKVKKILASGDNGTRWYDEVNAMKKFFLTRGVSPRDIFLDHAGFDTYSTVIRAREVFSVKDVVIVTQEFHLPRAIYIARKSGLEAWGYPADRRGYVRGRFYQSREYFARIKAFVNLLTSRSPRFLGEEIPITGDGRKSWD